MPRDTKASDRLSNMLSSWNNEWEEWKRERDSVPLNHRYRKVWDGICNTQQARISDLVELIGEYKRSR